MNPKNDDLKSTFARIYANLPLAERSEIIAVIGSQPMTWNVCSDEIRNNTKMGERILEYLRKLDLI